MPRRRDFGDIDGGEDRRAADREPAYEAEDEKGCPAGRARAAEQRDEIKDGEHAQAVADAKRSEEPTSELQSLMRISYAVFCLKHNNHADSKHKRQVMHQRDSNTEPYQRVKATPHTTKE